MTPKIMQRIAYVLISILIIIAIYPYVENSFYSSKYTEMAILGPTGKIGEYNHQVQLGEESSINIYLENHEKQTKLYKIVTKLVENSTALTGSSPFPVNPLSSRITILKDNENATYPIRFVIDQPFNGKIVSELYIFDARANTYLFYDRWVTIWMKTIN